MTVAYAQRRKGAGWLGWYVVGYLVFTYLPIVLIPLFSFNDAIQASFPLKGFTLDWYRSLAGNETLRAALVNSISIGALASVVATALGVMISYMEVFGRSPLARVVSGLARLPILIPGIVVGIALLILVNLSGLGPSRTAIVIGHILVALPTTVIVLRGRFMAIPKSLAEAAADLGAGEAVAFRRVLLPLAVPAIVSAGMLAFLTSFDEFIVAFFLAGTDPTLPLYIWSQLRFPKSLPTVMALGTVILAISVVLATAAELLRRRGLSADPSKSTTGKNA